MSGISDEGTPDYQQLEKTLREAREQIHHLQGVIRDIEDQLARTGLEGYPTEPGWYEDADKRIARLYISSSGLPVWDDGWGNAYPDEPLPALPLTRLVPEETPVTPLLSLNQKDPT